MTAPSVADLIRVQESDFDLAAEYARLAGLSGTGALVSFVGQVRDCNQGEAVEGLFLEHYPGMTERAMADLVAEARGRWPLTGVTLIHRVGALKLGEQIVLVLVASGHRGEAFAACEFLMDTLKSRVPFWKRERRGDGQSHWLAARDSDAQAAARWQEKPEL
ncbi:molybdopterin synthase catalytic subunit MoaE [Pseudaeromonas paramecii]|uniref:Molybdopterin synthase catalytic subunit n=1 Tax=Pseudaeromonas paramecii TaxID=2138166 RepID=A0ABP8QEU1_9GAMM